MALWGKTGFFGSLSLLFYSLLWAGGIGKKRILCNLRGCQKALIF
jgi:hypothetical protein